MRILVTAAVLLLACESQQAPRTSSESWALPSQTGAPVQARNVASKGAPASLADASVCDGCVKLSGIALDNAPVADWSNVFIAYPGVATASRYQAIGGVVIARPPADAHSLCIGSTEQIALQRSNCFAWAPVKVGP